MLIALTDFAASTLSIILLSVGYLVVILALIIEIKKRVGISKEASLKDQLLESFHQEILRLEERNKQAQGAYLYETEERTDQIVLAVNTLKYYLPIQFHTHLTSTPIKNLFRCIDELCRLYEVEKKRTYSNYEPQEAKEIREVLLKFCPKLTQQIGTTKDLIWLYIDYVEDLKKEWNKKLEEYNDRTVLLNNTNNLLATSCPELFKKEDSWVTGLHERVEKQIEAYKDSLRKISEYESLQKELKLTKDRYSKEMEHTSTLLSTNNTLHSELNASRALTKSYREAFIRLRDKLRTINSPPKAHYAMSDGVFTDAAILPKEE